MKFFNTRINANLFKNLYNKVHYKVINTDLIFNKTNKNKLVI